MLKYTKLLPDNNRPEIVDAVELIVARWRGGETTTAINKPPRYGKAYAIRLSALEIFAEHEYPCLMVAPWTDNVDQIRELAKIQDTYTKYGIER